MMTEIRKVGVLGAGVMGAAIAAHMANAGLPTVLFDIVPPDAEDRNVLAKSAIARLLKTRPAPLMHSEAAGLIIPGNLEDDLEALSEVDWVCEAVVEDAVIKQDIYRRLDKYRKDGSIVTSNTSTIPLKRLIEGLPSDFAEDFAVTHFFNPPRYMRLLEIVAGDQTDTRVIETLTTFADVALGKEVVLCKDTPGFIANRIGIYWMSVALSEALDLGLTVEQADSVIGRPMGIPKTGIFGLFDLTGIDLAPHVMSSMEELLPEEDSFRQMYSADSESSRLIANMISEGYIGRKGKGGFYRLSKTNDQRVKEARDLRTGEYREAEKPDFESVKASKAGLRVLVEFDDKGGQYAWRVLSRTLTYVAGLIPEIADDIAAVDRAMKTGYAWTYGPFEQIDQLGVGWFVAKLREEGIDIPRILQIAGERTLYREVSGKLQYLTLSGDYADYLTPPGVLRLSAVKRRSNPVKRNGSASLWDLGDGVAGLEFHTKLNALDAESIAMVREGAKVDKLGYKALVIGNDEDNFSVGANIGLALFAANTAMWPLIEQTVREGQETFLALKYAPFPVVGALAGMAFGGGLEVLLHCDAVQAYSESYVGLVEASVGIIPSWGGTKELILRNSSHPDRAGGPMPPLMHTFETIGLAKVSTSAIEARDLGFLRESDRITMNRDRVMADAKGYALELTADYSPPERPTVVLPGPTARVAFELAVNTLIQNGQATAHDGVIARALAEVISGGSTDITENISENDLLKLECKALTSLVKYPATLDRMAHMLETGKPLRN